jgi:hypothetical protein
MKKGDRRMRRKIRWSRKARTRERNELVVLEKEE